MAYLDLDNAFASPACSRAIIAAPCGFSALEWSVIALAKRDPLRSLSRPGRMSRALGGLFGLGGPSMLADPKLEALRRLAVFAWHRGFALPVAEIDRFLTAGFHAAQIETLVESVTGLHVGAPADVQALTVKPARVASSTLPVNPGTSSSWRRSVKRPRSSR